MKFDTMIAVFDAIGSSFQLGPDLSIGRTLPAGRVHRFWQDNGKLSEYNPGTGETWWDDMVSRSIFLQPRPSLLMIRIIQDMKNPIPW